MKSLGQAASTSPVKPMVSTPTVTSDPVGKLYQVINDSNITKSLDQKLKSLQNNPTIQKGDAAIEKIKQTMSHGVDAASEKILDTVLTPQQKAELAKRKLEKEKPIMELDEEGKEVRQPIKIEREYPNTTPKQGQVMTNKLSDKILVVAKWLESQDNELLMEASEEHLDSLALSLVQASDVLKEVAEEIKATEPVTPSLITPESLEEMAAVAAAFDKSGDPLLEKQAAVIDEILMTLSTPKDYTFNFKKAEEDKIDTLKKKYKTPKEELDENIGVKEALDALKKSPTFKEYRPLEASLSARTCFDHPGAPLARIAEGTWQCSLDHKVYNYDVGFTTLHGDKIGGGSVSEQTPKYQEEGHQMFDHRDGRLGIFRE
jgi:hypothetical protein